MTQQSPTTWTILESLSGNFTKEQFLKALDIWNNNPHVVNNRVHTSVVVLRGKLTTVQQDDLISKISTYEEDVSKLNTEQLHKLLEKLGLSISSNEESSSVEFFFKKLLPRSTKHFSTSFELVITDFNEGWALSCGFPVQNGASLLPKFPYRLKHDLSISIEVPCSQESSDPSLIWLKSNLLPQLKKWAVAKNTNGDSDSFGIGHSIKSHGLICSEKYTEVYQNLKIKYGQQIVKIWPECTDPAKFVYEDIAIASYILLLWEGKKPVSFVDLGCGNGLLVHILNSEGHDGIGIDLRSRKIWDLYPQSTKLQVLSITPSDSSLFPEAEWLLGNHSDELTPWIPVIAARSSHTCQFFVLPCCPFDFDGFKYRRKNSLLSQYSDFLIYMKQVSQTCGFQTDVDRLRIPSTKRICVVGRDRTYKKENWPTVNSSINQLIDDSYRLKIGGEENGMNVNNRGNNEWAPDFKPREAIEKVRNCTQLEENLISEIVSLTANHLLVKRRPLPYQNKPDKTWNAGGIAALGEIIPLIGSEKLKKLKSECGGLQTLLKNHHQVFLVEKGKVQFRPPIKISEVKENSKIRVKQKLCWFFQNHPDGCFLEGSECAYKH